MTQQGSLRTWSKVYSDVYLQMQQKRSHLLSEGDPLVEIKTRILGELGRIAGPVVATDTNGAVVLGALKHVSGSAAVTD